MFETKEVIQKTQTGIKCDGCGKVSKKVTKDDYSFFEKDFAEITLYGFPEDDLERLHACSGECLEKVIKSIDEYKTRANIEIPREILLGLQKEL